MFEGFWPYQPADCRQRQPDPVTAGCSLIDEYIVWTFPVIIGHGKRLFETTAKPEALRLISTQASRTGVVMSTYVPAGDIPLGSFAQTEPSEKELDRRAKMAHEDQ
jgi:hypothetical protein